MNNQLMINTNIFRRAYVTTQVLDEEKRVITGGIIGVSFYVGELQFQNIFMWYNPSKNVFENEGGQPIIIVYEYLSPDDVLLFKSGDCQRKVFVKRSYYTSITFVEIRKKDSV